MGDRDFSPALVIVDFPWCMWCVVYKDILGVCQLYFHSLFLYFWRLYGFDLP